MKVEIKDSKNRTQRLEVFFHDSFLAVHFHCFSDSYMVAQGATRSRKIWGCWYCSFETIIPRYAFEKIVEEKAAVEEFVKWYNHESRSNNSRRKEVCAD